MATLTEAQKQRFTAEAVEVTKSLQGTQGIEAEICGMWVWVKDITETHDALLKTIGFKYSKKKELWYWRNPACQYDKYRKGTEMSKIRERHGCMKVKNIGEE